MVANDYEDERVKMKDQQKRYLIQKVQDGEDVRDDIDGLNELVDEGLLLYTSDGMITVSVKGFHFKERFASWRGMKCGQVIIPPGEMITSFGKYGSLPSRSCGEPAEGFLKNGKPGCRRHLYVETIKEANVNSEKTVRVGRND